MESRHPRKCTSPKSNGEPCTRWAIKGGTVCPAHGGSAPQVKQAAKARAAALTVHKTAERMVARAGVDVDPIEHLLESLHRAAALVEVWGEMVAGLDEEAARRAEEHGFYRGEIGYSESKDEESPDELVVVSHDTLLALNRSGQATIHPFVTLYEQALERRARFAKLCIDAGVAARQVELAERQGQMLVQVIRGILGDLGVADRPEAPAVVRKHLSLVAPSRSLTA